jgi:hypothetical protein
MTGTISSGRRSSRGRFLVAFVASLIILAPALAHSDSWDARFHTTGLDGYALANLSVGDDLYVGGRFASAGTVVATNVARWDGAAWHALGSGLNDTVRRLVLWDGEIYACGSFTHAGDQTVNHVARWDGAQWHPVGEGLPSAPSAMAVYDGDLWCDGWRFDGAAWTEVVAVDSYVRDLIVLDGQLILGGSFTTAGGIAVDHVAAWDGSQVTALLGQPREVQDLEVVDGSLYALGLNVYGDPDPVTVWNGASWSVVGDLAQDFVTHYERLVNHGGQLRMMAVVSWLFPPSWWTDVATWDGEAWTWLDDAFFMAEARHCFVHDGDLLLSGRISELGETIVHGIGRITATGPESLGEMGLGFGGGLSWSVADVCLTPDGVAVGGTFRSVGPLVSWSVALWGGSDWQPRSAGSRNVTSLAWHDGQLHAFYWAGDVVTANLMAWTGEEWQELSGHGGEVPEVAFSWGGRLLSGDHDIIDWTSPQAPETFAEVAGVVTCFLDHDGALVVGGDFTAVAEEPANGVARYFDGTWSEVAGGITGLVQAITEHEGDLFAGGELVAAGGVPVAGVARLVAGAWQPVGDQLTGEVLALASYGGFVYAGGDFGVAGDEGRNLARWNGSAWQVVGGGTDRPVRKLAVFDGKLHLAGEFGVVGDIPAARFAIWDGTIITPAPAPAATIRLSRARPNPFNPATTVSFALDHDGPTRLDVIDVRGRRVRTLVDRWLPAGEHQATWDGRDGRGQPLPAGTYLLRLEAAGAARTTKTVLVE